MSESVWRLPYAGANIAVLACAHVRDGQVLPSALLERLRDADLIVTLGDMGSRSGLDRLQEIAPVLGVSGDDDEEDPRTRRATLLLEGDGYRVGCLYDARAMGLAAQLDPFEEARGALTKSRRLFGGDVDVLLHAGGGRADEASFGPKGSALSPGSPTTPLLRDRPSFLRLKVAREGCFGQIIWAA